MSDAGGEASFDRAAYDRVPEIAIDSGLRLAASLLGSVRASDSDGVRSAAASLRATALSARQAWSEWREGDEDAHAIDVAADEAWGTLYGRLMALAGDATAPSASRARSLASELFGDMGARFLGLSYEEQYETMTRILAAAGEPRVANELDVLLGAGSLDAVRAAHEPYRVLVEALRGDTWIRPVNVTRATYVRALAHAIHRYVRAVLAHANVSEPATMTATKRLLEGLDVHNAREPASVTPTAAAARVELPELP